MYDFKTLSPLDFEELVRDLLQAELDVRLESFKVGKDQGIDFRLAQGGGSVVVQAKHFSAGTFPALVRACKAENLKVAAFRPLRYVLATSLPLSLVQKEKIRAAMPSAPLSVSDVLGLEDLNNLVGRNPQIERKHFKLWLASSAILERILHSGVYNRTETEMLLIKEMTRKFVHNGSVAAAEAILARSGALIVSGDPGVGKTTLARMLVWLHAEQGWSVSVIDDIREAFELPLDDTKRLVFFDDFLGQVALSSDLVRSTDQRFPPFLQRVRAHKNLRFILTTRNYILRQAQAYSGRLGEPEIAASEFVLDVGSYTRSVRAKILYNHLYFSGMSRADLKLILDQDFFLQVIDHPNFNPRLINLLTSADYLAVAGDKSRALIQAVLDNPSELWERPYRTQFGPEARALMWALYFNEPSTWSKDLEKTFVRMLDAVGSNIPAADHPAAFRSTVKELEGSVLVIQDRRIRFSNPGVRDFLDRVVVEDRFLPTALGALCDYVELNQLWSIHKRAAKKVRTDLRTGWSQAMARMMESGTGNAIRRSALLIDSFSVFRDTALLPLVSAAASELEGTELEQGDSDLCRSLLENILLSGLPRLHMQETHAAISQAMSNWLMSWGGYLPLDELDSVADTLRNYGNSVPDAEAAVNAALNSFIEHLDESLADIDSHSELDDFEADLIAMMARYGHIDHSVAKTIEDRRIALYEGPSRSGYRYISRKSEELPDVSDDEIRSMFRGMPR